VPPRQLALVRRARVWDEHAARWNYVRPGQDWDDGEVTSPTELEQCRNEKELLRALQARFRLQPAVRQKGCYTRLRFCAAAMFLCTDAANLLGSVA